MTHPIVLFTVFFAAQKSNFKITEDAVAARSLLEFRRTGLDIHVATYANDAATASEVFGSSASLRIFHKDNLDPTRTWVEDMTELQRLYLQSRELEDWSYVYVELDMLPTPTFLAFARDVCDKKRSDLIYAYRGETAAGAINTGIFIVNNAKKGAKFSVKILAETVKIRHKRGFVVGGDNQIAVDNLVARKYSDVPIVVGNVSVDVIPIETAQSLVPEGFDQAHEWCCSHSSALSPTLHFNGKPKSRMLDNCCLSRRNVRSSEPMLFAVLLNAASHFHDKHAEIMRESLTTFTRTGLKIILVTYEADVDFFADLLPFAHAVHAVAQKSNDTWVNHMELLKIHFVDNMRNTGVPLLYVELDMFATSSFKESIEYCFHKMRQNRAEIAYTFRGLTEYGSANTGIIFVAVPGARVLAHLRKVANVTRQIIVDKGNVEGAENQLALDKIIQPNVSPFTTWTDGTISVFGLRQHDIAPYAPADCCGYVASREYSTVAKPAKAPPIFHFNGKRKEEMLTSCCKQLA